MSLLEMNHISNAQAVHLIARQAQGGEEWVAFLPSPSIIRLPDTHNAKWLMNEARHIAHRKAPY